MAASSTTGGRAAAGGHEDQAGKQHAAQQESVQFFLAGCNAGSQQRQPANREQHRIEKSP